MLPFPPGCPTCTGRLYPTDDGSPEVRPGYWCNDCGTFFLEEQIDDLAALEEFTDEYAIELAIKDGLL